MDSFKKTGDIERSGYSRLRGGGFTSKRGETGAGGKRTNNAAIALDMARTPIITTLTPTATDPWMLFLYALKAPATRDKYIERLIEFLDFLGYVGTK